MAQFVNVEISLHENGRTHKVSKFEATLQGDALFNTVLGSMAQFGHRSKTEEAQGTSSLEDDETIIGDVIGRTDGVDSTTSKDPEEE